MKSFVVAAVGLSLAGAGNAGTFAHYQGKCKHVSAAKVVVYSGICKIAVAPESAEGRSMVYVVSPPGGSGVDAQVKIFPNGQATIDGLPTRKRLSFGPGWFHYVTADNEEFQFAKPPANLEM